MSQTVIQAPAANDEKINNPVLWPKLTTFQLINLCIGIIGIQFAWSVQIALSSRVLEPLGANPFLYGLIWCAGPITGIFVQPIVGALSDRTWTKLGKRRPFMLIGAILTCISLVFFPQVKYLFLAAILIWIIDASINISQGPYRALVPDLAPKEQHAIGNAYLSFAFGVGSVIAFGAAPLIKYLYHIDMSVQEQYIMAAVAIISTVLYTCILIKEHKPSEAVTSSKKKGSLLDSYKKFIKLSPELHKLCAMQFFTWVGLMCIFLYFAPYVIHTIYKVPDLSAASVALQSMYDHTIAEASTSIGIGFALFNVSCLICAIPMGVISNKFGLKNVYTVALLFLVGASFSTLFISSVQEVYIMMAVAGISWAGILSCPFAMLCSYIPEGEEGSLMGIFNMFIAAPQLISATAIAWWISQLPVSLGNNLSTHYWPLAFLITGSSVLVGIMILRTVHLDSTVKH